MGTPLYFPVFSDLDVVVTLVDAVAQAPHWRSRHDCYRELVFWAIGDDVIESAEWLPRLSIVLLKPAHWQESRLKTWNAA